MAAAVLVLSNTIVLKYLIPKTQVTPLQIDYMDMGKSFFDRYNKLSTGDKIKVNQILNSTIKENNVASNP